jgi:hypothetical protein
VAGVNLSEAPSPPRFLFGVVRKFCRFEPGQIRSVKLLQNIVSKVHNSSQSWVENINMTDCISRINSNKHLPESPFICKSFKKTTFNYDVFIVH